MRWNTKRSFIQADSCERLITEFESATTMSATAQDMLLSAVSHHGSYKEKQLARSGDLGACSAGIIKRLRKRLRLYYIFIAAFPIGFIVTPVVKWALSAHQQMEWSVSVFNALLPMTLMPNLITQHVSLARFETVFALWLNSDGSEEPLSEMKTELAECVGAASWSCDE
jgi:hypothetical protein